MKPVSVYTWSHIKSKYFAMYSPVRTYVCNTPALAAYALNAASNWQNPPLGPPKNSLNYGTPQRYNFMGDAGWNPI